MAAGGLPAVADLEDLLDLGERPSGRLAAVDEVDASDRLGGVVAVSGRRTFSRRQQPLLLIEPQSLGRRACNLGEFPDPHSGLHRVAAHT